MININFQTTKNELLEKLTLEANETGELKIFIESLPIFLNSEVAFTVFNYQISSYPRDIIWVSESEEIAEFFEDLDINFEFLGMKDEAEEEIKTESVVEIKENPRSKFDIGYQNKVTTLIDLDPQEDVKKEEEVEQKAEEVNNSRGNQVKEKEIILEGRHQINSKESEPFLIDKTAGRVLLEKLPEITKEEAKAPETPEVPNFVLFENKKSNIKDAGQSFKVDKRLDEAKEAFEGLRERQEIQKEQRNSNLYNNFNRENIFKEKGYRQSFLIDETKNNPSFRSSRTIKSSEEDFDKWLNKIQATKSALNDLKKDKTDNLNNSNSSNPNNSFSSNRNSKFESYFKEPVPMKKNLFLTNLKLAGFGMGGLVLVFAVMSSIFFFPTTVYTVQTQDINYEGSLDANFDVADFNKRKTKLEVNSEIESSGVLESQIASNRSAGRVVLLNAGSRPISITNGAFNLIKRDGGSEYYAHISDPSLPKVITLSPNSDRTNQGIETTVQCYKTGSEHNLPAGTTFSILNGRNDSVGNSVYARAVSDIKATDSSGTKYVSQNDLNLLNTTNEGKLVKARDEELNNLQSEGTVYNDPTWYKNLESNQVYSAKEGDVADTISLKTDVTTEIYYLNESQLEAKILETNSEIEDIVDITMLDSKGSFDNPESSVEIKIYYTFHKKQSVNYNEIEQTLEGKDFEDAEKEIKEKYPNVSEIKREETGIQIPGVEPKKDLKIT